MEVVDLGPCQAFWSEGGERTAVFLPGRYGGALQPGFAYLRELLTGEGWNVLAVHDELGDRDRHAWPRERALAAFAFRRPDLVVGKSAATFAAEVVDVPAVWLTPLLHEPEVRAGIRAPALLVGGTSDLAWDPGAARALGVETLELDGVDHGLAVPGDALASLDAMRQIVEAVREFARRI